MAETKKQNEWIEWSKVIIVAVIVVFLLRSFVFATSIVEGESMYPALEDGDRLLFNKLIYIISEPKRGDIVIIQRPEKNYVKRIIGLPNETIEVRDHELYIDGEKQEETFVDEEKMLLTQNIGPEKIPQDHYYVMGDNRPVSNDSRSKPGTGINGLGYIERSEIIGKSEFVFYPFNEWQITR